MNMNKVYEGGVGPLCPDIRDMAYASNGFVLELGVCHGEGSTMAIEDGLLEHQHPLHIGVDWEDLLKEHRPVTPFWHLVIGDTRLESTLHQVLAIAGERRPGIIFIDTDHNYEQMKAELNLWGRIADDSTIWLYHDTHMFGPPNVEMVRAITEYADANEWTYEDYRQDSHGLGRMRK